MDTRLWPELPALEVADVCFTKNRVTGWRSWRRWLVSWGIRVCSRRKDEPPSFANHTFLVYGSHVRCKVVDAHIRREVVDYAVYEALGKEGYVERWLRERYENGHTGIAVYRHRGVTDALRAAAKDGMKHLEGKKYGKLKILAHAADYGLTKLWNLCGAKGEAFLFRRLACMENYPICSWAVSYIYDKWLYLPFTTPTPRATPDDLMDECESSDEWTQVFFYSNNT